MQVRLNITPAGARRNKRILTVEVPESATVRQVLEAYSEQYTPVFDINNMRGMMILLNNAYTKSNRIVGENDIISIIRPMRGG